MRFMKGGKPMAGDSRPGPDGKVERNARILALREDRRWTYRDIGEAFGITRQRACTIVKQARKRRERTHA